jgi:hypothetical protein
MVLVAFISFSLFFISIYYYYYYYYYCYHHHQKLEAAQMRFLRPLLGLTRLDRQRNPDIRNRLKVNSVVEDIIKLYQKKWSDHLERMDRSRLPRLAFQHQPWDRRAIPRRRWRDQEHLEL